MAQVAINSGRQTSERLITISETYPVEAVANWALRLPYLDEYMVWVESNYLVKRAWDDHHVIYVGQRTSEDQVPNRIDARVGASIDLLGYAIKGSKPEEGGELHAKADVKQELDVTLFWQTNSPVDENYHVFVQLLDAEGRLVTQHDGQPFDGLFPTSQLQSGETIAQTLNVDLRPDLAAGPYSLYVGLSRLDTMTRLPLEDDTSGENAIILDETILVVSGEQ